MAFASLRFYKNNFATFSPVKLEVNFVKKKLIFSYNLLILSSKLKNKNESKARAVPRLTTKS